VIFYRALRSVISVLLRAFYRIERPADPAGALAMEGPLMFVGNHPNGLVDPGLIFILARRDITFLAKAPLFGIPLIGQMLKLMGALPVYRKQDDPSQMNKNAGTLEAAAGALANGRCITIFPEGKSHSEPQLQELKTGAARIALMASERGANVRIVPIGLTYSEKNLFKSRVHVDVGAPIEASGDAVALTQKIFDGLQRVTLNLEAWEDLPLIETAEALYAMKTGSKANDPERLRAFAKGMSVLRDEQPARFESLKEQVLQQQRRLELVRASTDDLGVEYRAPSIARFVLRNLIALALSPLFLAGMVLFVVPYWIPVLLVRAFKAPIDVEATIKVLAVLLVAPLWFALVSFAAWKFAGAYAGFIALLGTLPLALFTRYYFERRRAALHDLRTFFVLGSRRRFRERMISEGEAIAAQIETVAEELRPRISAAS
jgi:glycerol-3-phosphate O-acyltransferase/dihydroxyacetone phosphate acyltransferase